MTVLLGYGAVEEISKDELTNYTLNRLGGIPTWIRPNTNPDRYRFLKCNHCRSPLRLICQIYAPLEGGIYERVIRLLECPRASCTNQSHRFTVVKSQYPDEQSLLQLVKKLSQSSALKKRTNIKKLPSLDFGSSMFMSGAPIAEQLTKKDAGQSNSVLDIPQTNSETEKTKNQEKDILPTSACEFKNETERHRASEDPAEETFEETIELIGSITFEHQEASPFPAHFMDVEEEAPLQSTANLYHHENELFEEYKRREGLIESCSGEDFDQGNAKQDWIQEVYEKNQPQSWNKVFKRFQQTCASNPHQILRYEWNGGPLFYTQDVVYRQLIINKEPPRCKRCQGETVFEFQLMPALLSLFKPSYQDGYKSSIDWGTLLVFSCKADCHPDDVSLKSAESAEDLLRRLRSGEVDEFVTEESILVQWDDC